jgi:hypothetical protein
MSSQADIFLLFGENGKIPSMDAFLGFVPIGWHDLTHPTYTPFCTHSGEKVNK